MNKMMDEIDELFFKYFEENKKVPFTIENGIKNALRQEKNYNRAIVLIKKIIVTIISILTITGGVAFATTQICNIYLKQQKSIESNKLFQNEQNISNYEYNLLQNDMIYNKETALYYKVINNIEEYSIYKSRIAELPEMSKKDFHEKFLFIIAWDIVRESHETDLKIDLIETDETNTFITLKQKENPNYDNKNSILYAIIENKYLKENIILRIKNKEYVLENFIDINKLKKDYTKEDAIKDGCIVLEDNELISNNLNVLDNFVINTKMGKKSFIRIYAENIEKHIIDVEFIEGVYYVYDYNIIIEDKEKIVNSYRKLEKIETDSNYIYIWIEEESGENFIGNPFVSIKK